MPIVDVQGLLREIRLSNYGKTGAEVALDFLVRQYSALRRSGSATSSAPVVQAGAELGT
ncbi:hypothetical protein [Amycolatopsis sp. cmx-4-61]|uniref:hypothetical protein n=1 Tax=Amycolatopsis sp. cmx-4-61 TaxID=2790937 RepID=UPI00397847BC